MHCSHSTGNLWLVGQVDTAPSHDVEAVPNLTLASVNKVSCRNQTGTSFRSHLVGEFDITNMSQDPALCEGCVPGCNAVSVLKLFPELACRHWGDHLTHPNLSAFCVFLAFDGRSIPLLFHLPPVLVIEDPNCCVKGGLHLVHDLLVGLSHAGFSDFWQRCLQGRLTEPVSDSPC